MSAPISTPAPTATIIHAIEAAIADRQPQRKGRETLFLCPAHDDHHPSARWNPEKQIWYCDVCDEGGGWMDLARRLGVPLPDRSPGFRPATPPREVTYDYRGADGSLLFQVVRRHPKGFAQRQPNGAWGLNGIAPVLYCLPELIAADPPRHVFVVEGEKDSDNVRSLGLVATTSPMGAGKWRDAYAESLRGRHVVLLPDDDEPGRKHMATIARSLLGVAASVRLVELPDLPEKGDVSDWLDAGGTREALIALVKATEPMTADDLANPSYLHNSSGHPATLDVPPFPVDVLPDALSRYVEEGAAAIGVPTDMIALPLLAFAAGTIGNSRAVLVKAGWLERPILWLAVVGAPGTGKSPALSHAQQPISALQTTAWDRHTAELSQWEANSAAAKEAKGDGILQPTKPVLEHYFSTDTTTEALAPMLHASPGLTVVRDELVGWVKSHDAYRRGGDRQNWLSLWTGSALKVDRRGAASIFVPRPTVSVVGGVQPDMLPELASEAGRADGFIDRFCIVWPDAPPMKWTEAVVDPGCVWAAEECFRRLRVYTKTDDTPVTRFTPQARRVFARWYDENMALVAEATGLAAGCFAKYGTQCARFALVLHCLHHPDQPRQDLEADTVRGAIAIMEYLRGHLSRVLPSFGALTSGRSAGLVPRVSRILHRAGGAWVSRTELHRGLGGSGSAEGLSAALAELETDGLVESREVPTATNARKESRWRLDKNYEDMKYSPNGANSSYLHNSSEHEASMEEWEL